MSGLVHASTSLLHSRSQFTRLVDSLQSLCRDRFLLFALSHDTPDLEQSVRHLSSCTDKSIGCLSDPLPVQSGHPFFSCSIAIFERNSCRSFVSLETGEGPTHVGRQHLYDKELFSADSDAFGTLGTGEPVNWDEIWNSRSSVTSLPEELKNVHDARTILYFSDKSSLGLATALHEHLPQADQLGIIAASTPFVTGRPFTLFCNGKVQSSGAVGVALRTVSYEKVLSFDGVVRLTRPMVVQRSEGNLIHELGDSLPARILVKAIQDHGLSDELVKDIDYYIGIRDVNGSKNDVVSPRLLKIIAGSPSRGSIAVEEVPAPPVGSHMEFYYRLRSSPVHLQPDMLQHSHRNAGSLIGAIVNAPEDNTHSSLSSTSPKGFKSDILQTFDSTFVISSELGFILRSSLLGQTTGPWKCTVPSAFGGFRFL